MKTNTNTYQYIEDNAGGLFLFVLDAQGRPLAGIQNLEYAYPGEGKDVRADLEANPLGAVETWEGQIDQDELAELKDFFDKHEFGSTVVAESGNRIYPGRMGAAAKGYFGIEDDE